MSELDDILKEFLIESNEGLDLLDQDLIELEKDPGSKDLIARIFRTVHTIKGTSGVLGFEKLTSISHVGENLLSRMRDGKIILRPEITTALLAMVDAIRNLLGRIGDTGEEGNEDFSAVVKQVSDILGGEVRPGPKVVTGGLAEANGEKKKEEPPKKASPGPQAVSEEPKEAEEPAPALMGQILLEQTGVTPDKVYAGLKQQADGDPRRIGEILVASGAVEPPAVVDALRTQNEQRGQDISSSTIRVDVGLLDRLMNLVGELVLARNQVLQFSASESDSGFVATAQKLNLITTELQESVMKTRMQPIGNVWGKFPRIVRDLSLSCGKKVQFEMEGSETELDKTIIEAIKDPLTHIVRNSVDHGIELPAARLAAGKPETGRLLVRAFHEGGQVNIEIIDDGGGIHVDRVKAKAMERGLVTPAQLSRMSEKEAMNLIFLPGLSTAAAVTNISGRGVGMDVVKTNIERIGGTIDLQSTPGTGTTLKIKIPLTLAIVPALIVTASGERFAIPQISLTELVRLEGDAVTSGIESVYGAPVYRLRGNLLPLVFLNKELELSDGGATRDVVNIVVLQADNRQFGLVVDEINDTEEIVVKPLGKQLKSVPCFAGATIMGDGTVALIIDVFGMAQKASVTGEAQHGHRAAEVATLVAETAERQQWLVFKAGSKDRIAMPLSAVARLEEIHTSKVERSRGREVVQYRGEIMPLVRITSLVGLPATEDREVLQVVVYSDKGRGIGLVVDEIVDVAEEAVDKQESGTSQGLLGSAVIQQRVTDLLDIAQAVAAADRGVTRSKLAKVGSN